MVEALRAQIKYLVRISTTAANVKPDFPIYYPRTHWAIEKMLSQPEFRDMHWTSLQPNLFLPHTLSPAVDFVRKTRYTRPYTQPRCCYRSDRSSRYLQRRGPSPRPRRHECVQPGETRPQWTPRPHRQADSSLSRRIHWHESRQRQIQPR